MKMEDRIGATQVMKDEKKLILLFSEDTLARKPIQLKYDGNKSGTLALTDEFGNKVIPFTVSIEVEEEMIKRLMMFQQKFLKNLRKKWRTPEDTEDPTPEDRTNRGESPDEEVSEEGQAEENEQLVDETIE